ncbi:MAG: thioredoxin domain-containing protein [Acidimicrobiales bacterium]
MNRLANETSPYLRQHAGNPVDWYPWGDEAFARAAATDRPIFLSIGYSACHWCHVMAHESFEDEETAAMLNDSFVSIKVDREERPDVDAVYMEAVQALIGSGGWPMSMFLTPDGRPFFGGTYFPTDDPHGTPSFRTVLHALTDVWTDRRSDVEKQADELSRAVAERSVIARPGGSDPVRSEPTGSGTEVPGGAEGTGTAARPELLDAAVSELADRFDPTWGGFGPAPKFPHPTLIDVALRHAQQTGAALSVQMATTTLDAMAAGGIHDHLGGGFARYSTDGHWLVPHFEKMLYDQAGLLRSYLHGWQVTKNTDYLHVAERIIDYVTSELASPAGGLYSAEDADSEGVEGKFYVWTPAEVTEAVGPATADEVSAWFGVTPGGNFEGSTILRRPLGAPLTGPPAVEDGRRRLFEYRSHRVRPGLDDKVLTEWNAMFCSALAEAAAAAGRSDWGERAVAVSEFLWRELRRPEDGRWLRSWQSAGGARHLAYAADYAWLIDCFTRLGELTGTAVWTERAAKTADGLFELFHDDADGGFFTTGRDAEALIVRTKDVFDGAIPAANSVAALSLARLSALTDSDRYRSGAAEIVDLLGDLLLRHPTAFATTLLAAQLLAGRSTEIVVAGDRPDLVEVVHRRWLPEAVLSWGEPTPSPLWEGRAPGHAYVCHNYACQLPAGDPGVLATQLDGRLR